MTRATNTPSTNAVQPARRVRAGRRGADPDPATAIARALLAEVLRNLPDLAAIAPGKSVSLNIQQAGLVTQARVSVDSYGIRIGLRTRAATEHEQLRGIDLG
jgi:hypothetical protein